MISSSTNLVNLFNFVDNFAGRSLKLDCLTLFLAHEGSPERRGVRDFFVNGIGLPLTNDFIGLIFTPHLDSYFATNSNCTVTITIDHLGFVDNTLELFDTTLDKGELFFSGVILGILGEIAKIAGPGHAVNRSGELDIFEFIQLGLDLGKAGGGELSALLRE